MPVTNPVVKTGTLKKQKSNQLGYWPPPGKWPIRKVVLSPGRKEWNLGAWCMQCQTCDCRWKMCGHFLGVFGVHVVWRIRSVHAELQTIRSIFIYLLCVCMFLLEMVGVTTKVLVHAKVEGLTKDLRAPRQPLLHPTIHFSSDSRPTLFYTPEYMWFFFLQRPRHERMALIEDDQFYQSKEKGPLYTV